MDEIVLYAPALCRRWRVRIGQLENLIRSPTVHVYGVPCAIRGRPGVNRTRGQAGKRAKTVTEVDSEAGLGVVLGEL